ADRRLAADLSLEVNDVGMWQSQLVRVFDDDEPLIRWDLGGERTEQRALPGRGRTDDEHVRSRAHRADEEIRGMLGEAPARGPRRALSAERKREPRELAYRDRRAADRRDDGVRAA